MSKKLSEESEALHHTKLLVQLYCDETSMYYDSRAALDDAKEFLQASYGKKFGAMFVSLTKAHYRKHYSAQKRDHEAIALYDTELFAEACHSDPALLDDARTFIEMTYGQKFAKKFERLARPHRSRSRLSARQP